MDFSTLTNRLVVSALRNVPFGLPKQPVSSHETGCFATQDVPYWKSERGIRRTDALSDVLTDEQKIRKVGNLLSALKKDGIIQLSEKENGF